MSGFSPGRAGEDPATQLETGKIASSSFNMSDGWLWFICKFKAPVAAPGVYPNLGKLTQDLFTPLTKILRTSTNQKGQVLEG